MLLPLTLPSHPCFRVLGGKYGNSGPVIDYHQEFVRAEVEHWGEIIISSVSIWCEGIGNHQVIAVLTRRLTSFDLDGVIA